MVEEAIKTLHELWRETNDPWYEEVYNMAIEALSAEAVQVWIPVKWHEITDEEREREGYPKDWVVHIDCEMPCDEQEILVQTKSGYVRWDVCYEDGEFCLDSGWDWIDDIVAWRQLPEPYKGGAERE
ncbi:MAG: hypothetical protein IKF75_01825 [Lachnospiraceae bacterium]|nr:hypothetical protein [Lachnospiraceae bacterium]